MHLVAAPPVNYPEVFNVYSAILMTLIAVHSCVPLKIIKSYQHTVPAFGTSYCSRIKPFRFSQRVIDFMVLARCISFYEAVFMTLVAV